MRSAGNSPYHPKSYSPGIPHTRKNYHFRKESSILKSAHNHHSTPTDLINARTRSATVGSSFKSNSKKHINRKFSMDIDSSIIPDIQQISKSENDTLKYIKNKHNLPSHSQQRNNNLVIMTDYESNDESIEQQLQSIIKEFRLVLNPLKKELVSLNRITTNLQSQVSILANENHKLHELILQNKQNQTNQYKGPLHMHSNSNRHKNININIPHRYNNNLLYSSAKQLNKAQKSYSASPPIKNITHLFFPSTDLSRNPLSRNPLSRNQSITSVDTSESIPQIQIIYDHKGNALKVPLSLPQINDDVKHYKPQNEEDELEIYELTKSRRSSSIIKIDDELIELPKLQMYNNSIRNTPITMGSTPVTPNYINNDLNIRKTYDIHQDIDNISLGSRSISIHSTPMNDDEDKDNAEFYVTEFEDDDDNKDNNSFHSIPHNLLHSPAPKINFGKKLSIAINNRRNSRIIKINQPKRNNIENKKINLNSNSPIFDLPV